MYVVKRNGKREVVSFDKVLARVKKLCYELNPDFIDSTLVSMKVIQGIYDGVTTTELDNLAAETAATMATIHPDYAKLAARIAVSNLHKNTSKSFSKVVKELYHYIDPKTGQKAGLPEGGCVFGGAEVGGEDGRLAELHGDEPGRRPHDRTGSRLPNPLGGGGLQRFRAGLRRPSVPAL